MYLKKFFLSNLDMRHFLWLIPFICFFSGYYLLKSLCVVTHIEAPSLVGKTISQATTVLSALNLNPRIIAQKEDPDLEPGTIIHQNPAPSQMVKPHQSIFLVMSCLPEKPLMPEIVGKKEEDIVQELESAHITHTVHSVPSVHPLKTCCAQSPSAENPISTKAVVYISGGTSKPVVMPNLKHKSVIEVQEFLNQYPVHAEIIHTFAQPFGHRCQECVVVDQRPLEGSIVTLTPEKKMTVQLKVVSR